MVLNASNLGVVSKHGIECVAFDVGQDADTPNKKAFKGLTQSLLGSLKVLRKLGKHLRQEVSCIQALARGFDLIIGSQTSLAAPLVARALGKPWVFSGVSPMAFVSFIDPPYLHGLRWLGKDSVLPLWWKAVLRWVFLKLSDVIYVDYRQIEQELGLPHQHPLFSGRYSPWLNLALFSPLLAEPQSDWPEKTVQCGFLNDNIHPLNHAKDEELACFLASGQAPVVFTLGSVSRVDPQSFYDLALKVIDKLGVRAVLIKRAGVQKNIVSSPSVYVCEFADYSMLFSASQCVVHHGGVATLMQVIATGKPSLIIPRTLDQFDQAARAKKLGVAEVLPFKQLSEGELFVSIASVLGSTKKNYSTFLKIAGRLHLEGSVRVACKEIERLLIDRGVRSD